MYFVWYDDNLYTLYCRINKRLIKGLLYFWSVYKESLLKYITLGLTAGAKVISYSDPLTSLEILGRKNGQEIAEELILPFFKEISSIPCNGVIHVILGFPRAENMHFEEKSLIRKFYIPLAKTTCFMIIIKV